MTTKLFSRFQNFQKVKNIGLTVLALSALVLITGLTTWFSL